MNDEIKLGSIFLICCGFFWFYGIPNHIQGDRAALFPKILIVVLVLISILILIKGIRIRGTDLEDESWSFLNEASVRSLATVPIMVVYIFLVELIGFYTVTAAFIAIYMVYFGARKPIPIVLFSVLLPAVVYLIIGKILSFPFPEGILF